MPLYDETNHTYGFAFLSFYEFSAFTIVPDQQKHDSSVLMVTDCVASHADLCFLKSHIKLDNCIQELIFVRSFMIPTAKRI